MSESGKEPSRSPGLLPRSLSEGWRAHTAVAPPPTDPPQIPTDRPDTSDVQPGSPVVNRYQDAYRVGAALVGLGDALKVVGGVLAGIIILGSLSLLGENPFGLVGVFIAAIVGALFWVGGVIVAAQGQILRATLDSAVAHSPFLTDHERLNAMGLPRSIAERSVGP